MSVNDTTVELLRTNPFSQQAGGANATGLFAPIFRAMSHLMLLIIVLQQDPDDENRYMSEEEMRIELVDAAEHLNFTLDTLVNVPISLYCQQTILTFVNGIQQAALEFPTWSNSDQVINLITITNGAAQLGVIFDLEFAGISGSHAGSTL